MRPPLLDGYRFPRSNRFNVGKDAVATLDERLAKLVELATDEQSAKIVERLRAWAEGMLNREMRQCPRCSTIKPLQAFFHPDLKGGRGDYGCACANAGSCRGRRGRSPLPVRRRETAERLVEEVAGQLRRCQHSHSDAKRNRPVSRGRKRPLLPKPPAFPKSVRLRDHARTMGRSFQSVV
jgi:hypothetical protein